MFRARTRIGSDHRDRSQDRPAASPTPSAASPRRATQAARNPPSLAPTIPSPRIRPTPAATVRAGTILERFRANLGIALDWLRLIVRRTPPVSGLGDAGGHGRQLG